MGDSETSPQTEDAPESPPSACLVPGDLSPSHVSDSLGKDDQVEGGVEVKSAPYKASDKNASASRYIPIFTFFSYFPC